VAGRGHKQVDLSPDRPARAAQGAGSVASYVQTQLLKVSISQFVLAIIMKRALRAFF
jgi:hypothetical protein